MSVNIDDTDIKILVNLVFVQGHTVQTSQVETESVVVSVFIMLTMCVLAIRSLEKFFIIIFSNVYETFVSYLSIVISESEVEI